eukprot:5903631-Prymnesium_polylepis.1
MEAAEFAHHVLLEMHESDRLDASPIQPAATRARGRRGGGAEGEGSRRQRVWVCGARRAQAQ